MRLKVKEHLRGGRYGSISLVTDDENETTIAKMRNDDDDALKLARWIVECVNARCPSCHMFLRHHAKCEAVGKDGVTR